MSVFLGIGLGPIQTGIFLSGAAKGGFDRLVIAEVDAEIGRAVRANGGAIVINIAGEDRVTRQTISGVEVYNPVTPDGVEALKAAAAEANELATALPSVDFFSRVAPWLKEGFARDPGRRRFIYAAENNNHAAELLKAALGDAFPATWCLNTVIGKMSKVFAGEDGEEQDLKTLTPDLPRGHLVEAFDKILISACPGIEERRTAGLYVKQDLYPFEEAKLYGHNAVHFLIGTLCKEKGYAFMNQARQDREIMAFARETFLLESGEALCRKWKGEDPLFTQEGYAFYVDDLLRRMTNPYLRDAVDRICRDPLRKMAWEDRVVGTMRVALSQNVAPRRMASIAFKTAREIWGGDAKIIREGLAALWPKPWAAEHDALFDLIAENAK